ncbi:MAG: PAS domain-containing sensor histidine kinase [Ignavibacteriales bacterium]|nr:PAS domain-containing sensor histidine kinase [Ignavibacteriales bacterium]
MVFDSSSDAIFLVQPDTNFIIIANLKARELFEIPDGTDLSTTKGFVYHKYTFSAEEIAAIAESLKTTGKWSSEIEYVSMKGREFWGEIVITEFNFHEEKFILVRITDISERREKLSMLESMTEELRETNDHKDKFISILAHDLRGPFHPLLNSLELLDSEFDSLSEEEKKNFIKNSFETANNQYHLLESILSWSRASQNNLKAKFEQLRIHEVVVKSIQQVASVSGEKGIIIENKCDQTIEVVADNEMILTVLRNLLTNAIKFSEPGNNVVVSSKIVDGMIITSVADHGQGILQERLDKMFNIASAKSTPGTRKEKGSGLGLLICKELTEKMDGTLSVESEQNRGTTVSFTLPAAKC